MSRCVRVQLLGSLYCLVTGSGIPQPLPVPVGQFASLSVPEYERLPFGHDHFVPHLSVRAIRFFSLLQLIHHLSFHTSRQHHALAWRQGMFVVSACLPMMF